MKAATRFLVGGLSLVILATALVAAGVLYQVGRTTHQQATKTLALAGIVEADLQTYELQALQLRAQALAGDPAFVDYVAQSLQPNPQLGGVVDKASISDLLNERRHGYDMAMVLDAQGKWVTTSGVVQLPSATIQNDPLVIQAVHDLKPSQGIRVSDGHLLWVAVNPLLRGASLQGLLVTATGAGAAFANAVGHMSRSDVVFVTDATTNGLPLTSAELDASVAQSLAPLTPQLLGVTDPAGAAIQLPLSSQTVTAWVTPLPLSAGHAAMVAFKQNAGTQNSVPDEARPFLFAITILGGLGILYVLLQWWRTWRPLQNMLDVIERAGAGDAFMTIREDGSLIVRLFRDRLNHLMHPDR